jgi:hypothetical protein
MQHSALYWRRRNLVAAGLSLVMLATLGQEAYPQNNAAKTAAGAIILQNNRTQQELRETKRELREIKEGLGIESSDASQAGNRTAIPHSAGIALLALLFAFCTLAGIGSFIWIASQSAKVDQYLNDGNAERLQRALRARNCFLPIFLPPVLLFVYAGLWSLYRKDVVPNGQEWKAYTTIFGIPSEYVGWSMALAYAWVFARWVFTTRESVVKRLIKTHRETLKTVKTSS